MSANRSAPIRGTLHKVSCASTLLYVLIVLYLISKEKGTISFDFHSRWVDVMLQIATVGTCPMYRQVLRRLEYLISKSISQHGH